MGFSFDDALLNSERMRLQAVFEKKASDLNIDLYQKHWDQSVLNLCDRLFDARHKDRWINIDLSDYPSFDGFTKKCGHNDEVSLLCVTIPKDSAYTEQVWDLYYKWLHAWVSDDEMETILESLRQAG